MLAPAVAAEAEAVVVVELRVVLHLAVVVALRVLLLLVAVGAELLAEHLALLQPCLAHKLLLPVLLQVAVVLRAALQQEVEVVAAAPLLLEQGPVRSEILRRR